MEEANARSNFIWDFIDEDLKEGRYTAGEIVHHKIELTPENIDDPGITLSWDNDATSIQSVHDARMAANGCYNLAGQRVARPTKGLYIVNGKKVVIK